MAAVKAGVLLLVLLVGAAGKAQEPTLSELQQHQLESLRREIAGQLQLQAYELLDELVYGWTQQPVFGAETPVVLADVSVPVGFGTGLQALIENHFASLVVKNRKGNVVLAHCPACTALIVHSGQKGTVVARGVDSPEALTAAGRRSESRHALFLDFEAEGAALVLRARITSLEPSLPIVYAKTLSTSTTSAALLRSDERLKSAAEARQEYLDALQGRSRVLVPIRMGVRTYAGPQDSSSIAVPPFVWLMMGAEVALTQARAWTGSFSLGISWTPELQTSWLAQARLSRLLSGATHSLTQPDVYGFVGGSLISIHGVAAQLFRPRVPTIEELIAARLGVEAQTRFAAFQLGLELRVKNRIGLAAYLETAPALNDISGVGNYLDLGLLRFQTIGAEVSFCF